MLAFRVIIVLAQCELGHYCCVPLGLWTPVYHKYNKQSRPKMFSWTWDLVISSRELKKKLCNSTSYEIKMAADRVVQTVQTKVSVFLLHWKEYLFQLSNTKYVETGFIKTKENTHKKKKQLTWEPRLLSSISPWIISGSWPNSRVHISTAISDPQSVMSAKYATRYWTTRRYINSLTSHIASQLVTWSTCHTVKSRDELTVVRDSIVTRWP